MFEHKQLIPQFQRPSDEDLINTSCSRIGLGTNVIDETLLCRIDPTSDP